MLCANSATALSDRLSRILPLVNKAFEYRSNSVTDAVFESEKSLFAKLANLADYDDKGLDEILTSYSTSLFDYEGFSEALRLKAAEAGLALAPLAVGRVDLSAAFEHFLRQAETNERSYSVREVLRQIKTTKFEKT